MKDICLIAIKVRRSNGTFFTLPTIKGEPGINGKSAYQVAVDNGFVGTEEEWLESLKQGPAGATGNYNQFIYYRTTDSAPPATPVSEDSDDFLPTSWTRMPMGVTSVYKYEWVTLRIKKDDIWGTYSAPALWAIYGFGDTLPEINIDDVTGLEEALNEFADAENKFIPKSYLFDNSHTKVATLNAINTLPTTVLPIATSLNLGAFKVGSTLQINPISGVLNTNLSFRGLTDSDLVEAPVNRSAIVWDSLSGKYINMETPIDELYHPLYGKDTLDFLAKTLRSITLVIPKVAGTPSNNEVSLHALENGYSLEEPVADLGAKWLTDLLDVELTNPVNDDGLFMVNGNFVNKPAYTKEQIQNLFVGLSTTYHPYGGSDTINFRAKELRSKTLFIPTETTPSIPVGVAISAIENGYSIVNPEDNIVEFSDLQDIISLLWINGQTIIYRNGVFVNESIYNKAEIDAIVGNLNMSDYLKKVDAASKYHPKFGLDNNIPLDFTADRLKSNTLIIPKGIPDLEPNEVAIHALENGYSIEEPGNIGVTSLSALEDVTLTAPLVNNQILAYSLASQRWVNLLLSFNMFSDELSANSILVNDNRKFVSNAQIADWNSRWIYDENTIKAVKVNLAADSEKLGGILAGEYWHTNNSNLDTVDWKAKILRSKVLVVPKELPTGLLNNEIAIYALENGYSIAEPGGGSTVQVLDDLADVINTTPQNNDVLRYNTTQSAYVNGPIMFSMIGGTLYPTSIATSSLFRFVTDAQILAWNAKESLANKNQPDGYLGLNSDKKIDFIYFPDAILGQVKYGGTIAANGIITSPFIELNGLSINVLAAVDYTGYFFIPQADGTFAGIEAKTGDWIISNGAAGWSKVDNTDAVTSVNGRIGAIILSKSDVGLSNVDNTADANKNVLSATKLFTPRTLWGQSFDGTGNVSGSLSDVDNLTGSGILNMGTILIPKTINPNIPLNTVSISALDNGYSIAEPEAGSVGSLDDLLDVDLIARVDKQLLHYSTLLGKFTNDIIDFSYLQGQLGADRITQSPDYRFVTDAQKLAWNTKQDALNFVTVTEGKYLRDDNTFQTIETLTTEERSHLTSAYNHSTTFGNPHLTKVNELSDAVISGAVTGEVLMYNASTAKWYNAKVDITDVVDLQVELNARSLTTHLHDDRYYTETEIANFFSGSVAISGYNKSNWDTAFGWGNHASAGYALASSLTNHTGNTSNPHSVTFAQLLSKPTTLSGYGITDAVQHKVGIISSTDYRHSGYGYTSGGWVTSGAAMTFGANNLYYALLQASGNTLHFNYVFEGNIGTWKQIYHSGNSNTSSVAWAASTFTEGGVSLASKYLGINAKAADSNLFDGIDSSRFVYGDNERKSTNIDGITILDNIRFSAIGIRPSGTDTSLPQGLHSQVLHSQHPTSNEFAFQLMSPYGGSEFFFRKLSNGVWGSLYKFYHSGNSNLTTIDWSAQKLTLNGNLNYSGSTDFSIQYGGTTNIRVNTFGILILSSNAQPMYFRPNGSLISTNEMSLNTNGVLSVPSLTLAGSISGATTGSFSGNVSASSFTSGGNAVLHAGNYSSYALPLSGGTLSGLVTFNGSALFSNTFSLYVRRPSENSPNIVMQNHDSLGNVRTLGYLTMLADDNLGFFRADGTTYRTVIHSGNSNSTSFNWSAKNLTLAGSITGATTITASSTIQATTAKLTNLTDGYIPYHISDASGLGNSPIFVSESNVGIGTTNPTSQLDGTTGLSIVHSSAALGLSNGTNKWLNYLVGTTYRLYNNTAGDILTSQLNGNIGIGYTTDQGYKLAVAGSGYFNGNLSASGIRLPYNVVSSIWGQSNGGIIQILSDATTTNRWVRMGISTYDGVWGGGLTVRNDLSVYSDGYVQSASYLRGTSLYMYNSRISTDGNSIDLNYGQGTTLNFYGGTTATKMTVSTSGALWAASSVTAPAFYHSSDMTLKNVISPLESSLDKLRNMSTFYYTLKDDSSQRIQLGMSAQEFDTYFPTLVGRDSNDKLQLEYPRISVLAVKAIQELDKMQQTQEEEIKQLKLRVKDLETKLYESGNY